MTEIVFKEESYKIIGACMTVHNELGPGFLEAVYQEALEREFIKNKIPYQREVTLDLYYQGVKLKKKYRADFICYNKIMVETKAVSMLPAISYRQIKNYLKSAKFRLGILINFGEASLVYKRILNPIH